MQSMSEKIYRVLLYLYPTDFRRTYGDDMLQLFRDLCRDAKSEGNPHLITVWKRVLPDVITSIVRENLETMRPEIMTTIKIDEYEVKACVAKGATAHIYLVTDPANQQDVIMKLWKPEDSFDADTLKREIDAMITLKHQNIPEVYKYVENDEFPYLIMEYIEGNTLLDQAKAAESFIPESTIIEWALQMCDILNHLHSQQPTPYIFRDIKPSNFILDAVGKLHLIDFGITVPHQVDHQYDLIGTQGYAPPEQYKGYVDVRSDIYALGATLHHIATKVDPRPNHNLTTQVFTFAPPRSINPDLSKAFAHIIAKATAYEREDRFQTVDELKEDLLAYKSI